MTELKQLYKDYSAMVYTIAISYLRNKEEAEEVTQDVFIKVHHNLNEFREESTLKTWIYRITVNLSLDYLKARGRNKRSLISSVDDFTNVEKIEFDHPGAILERKEQAAVLLNCINRLPKSQKTAFILSKIDGLKQKEIAAIMNKSISGIESLIFKAKQNLREQLKSIWDQQQGS